MNIKKKIFALISLMLVIALVATGCSSTTEMATYDEAPAEMMAKSEAEAAPALGGETYAAEDAAYYEDSVSPEESGSISATDEPVIQERKLVYTTNLTLETIEYDKTLEEIQALIAQTNGYIESSNMSGTPLLDGYSNRYASFSVRIPADSSESFIKKINETYHVRDTSQYVEDITKSYYDTDTWLKTLEQQYKRLEELQAQAENLEDLLEIEKQMASVRADITNTYNYLQSMDQQVNYSTVYININEVKKETGTPRDSSFGERIKVAFSDSWGNFVLFLDSLAVWFVLNLPFIILLAAVIILAVFIVRKAKSKGKIFKKKPKKDSKTIDKDEKE